MHTSLQRLDQAAAGRNPKLLARDVALPPTSQARAEADLQPMQHHKIFLTWQYQIHYLGWKIVEFFPVFPRTVCILGLNNSFFPLHGLHLLELRAEGGIHTDGGLQPRCFLQSVD